MRNVQPIRLLLLALAILATSAATSIALAADSHSTKPASHASHTSHASTKTVTRLLTTSDSARLRGWWGDHAVLNWTSSQAAKPHRFTRVVVRHHAKRAGIESWPRIATDQAKGTRIVAHASVRKLGAGGLICLRVREFHGTSKLATTTQCAAVKASWKSIALSYRLRAPRSSIGVTVFRRAPRRGASFDVAHITLRATHSVAAAPSDGTPTPATTTTPTPATTSTPTPATTPAPTPVAASAPTQAATSGLLLGISANSQGWGTHAGTVQDQVAALGIHWMREDFERSGPGALDQTKWDAVIGQAAARHISILPVFTDPADYQDTAFVAAAVARYAPGGTFWTSHPTLDSSYAPTWWEVGNEPWLAGQTPAGYAQDYKAAVIAGRAANSQAKFLLAAFPVWQNPATGNWEQWVTPMYAAVPDLGNYVDGWSDHPYSGDPSVWTPSNPAWYWQFQQFTKVHAEFAAHGGGSLPMWLTEFGYATAGSDRTVTEQQQASYITTAFDMLASVPYAKALFIYQLQDWGPRDSDREHHFGIENADGSPKLAYAAVKALAATTG